MYVPEIQLPAFVLFQPGLRIEVAVMVASNNNLLLVRQRTYPVQLSLNILCRAQVRQISGVNEDIAIRDRYRVCVGVCYTNDFDKGLVLRWFERCTTETQEDRIDDAD